MGKVISDTTNRSNKRGLSFSGSFGIQTDGKAQVLMFEKKSDMVMVIGVCESREL